MGTSFVGPCRKAFVVNKQTGGDKRKNEKKKKKKLSMNLLYTRVVFRKISVKRVKVACFISNMSC